MKISVITAVFNARETVVDTIESILCQSHPDVELIVVDGGSTDGTVELLNRYKDKLSAFISEPDTGIYDALTKGVAHATGEAVGFLHADDLFTGVYVLEMIAGAFSDSSVDAVYGDLVYVSKTNTDKVMRYWRAGEFNREQLRCGWMPPHPTLYVRRTLYKEYGGFDASYRIAADYDCILRLLSNIEGKVVYIPEVLVRMRLGGVSNRSASNIVRKSWEDYRALRENGIGGIGALAWKNISKLGQFIRRK